MQDIKHNTCPVCSGNCLPLDAVDFNKTCLPVSGKSFEPRGELVEYVLCDNCQFCYAPELSSWPVEQFKQKIYNKDYAVFDPEYDESRPQTNAEMLLAQFRNYNTDSFRHLDYGGGNGYLTKLLRDKGWQSTCYDPLHESHCDINKGTTYDFITAFEVFEHVPDVNVMMSHFQKLLSPRGAVLFSTLVSDGEIAMGQPLTWWYASPRNGHISLYSKKSLKILGHKYGLLFGTLAGLCFFLKSWPNWYIELLLHPIDADP